MGKQTIFTASILPKNRKIIITVPRLDLPGGVSSLYNILKMDQYASIQYFSVNSRFRGAIGSLIGLPIRYLIFFFKALNTSLIHLNPSLDAKSYYRDMLFCMIGRATRCKIVVYWHGWQIDFGRKLMQGSVSRFLFNHSFGKADTTIVLGKIFKSELEAMGYKNEILIGTNAADDIYLSGPPKPRDKADSPCGILFISRIEKEKGIYEVLQTAKILNTRSPDKFKFYIAGTGIELEKAKTFASDLQLTNMEFTGQTDGLEKHNLFLKSSILFFPTYYPEGLPIVILEAMIYGLPVITRPVGGIPDIIENGVHGFLTESLDPTLFAERIEQLFTDSHLYSETSSNNIKFATEYILPDKVRTWLQNVYLDVINRKQTESK
jgi:glycosyltransferase involved in cell wall biosynthesis